MLKRGEERFYWKCGFQLELDRGHQPAIKYYETNYGLTVFIYNAFHSDKVMHKKFTTGLGFHF